MNSRAALLVSLVLPLTPLGPARAQQVASDNDGYARLFDGSSLEGWTPKGGRYDGNAVWTVEDGAIVGCQADGRGGGLLYTEGYYASFDLELETRIDYPFDSGIFLHMVPRKEQKKGLQVTLDYRPSGEVGGIYADGWLHHNETGKKAFRRDAWNRMRVRCAGSPPRVQVWLNGDLITDYTRRDGGGYAKSGRIGLQVHGGRDDPGKARFRNLRIRELPSFDRAAFDVDDAGFLMPKPGSGWEPILNGEDMAGWEIVGGSKAGCVVEDGVLSFPKKGGGGYIRTVEDYEDFRLRLDFKIAFMANSGVFLRGARDGSNPAYSGCEIQILDDFNWEKVTRSKLQPYQFTGGLYGSVPAGAKALYPLGRWNTYDITYEGSRIKVELNGRVLYDVDTNDVPGKPFSKRAKEGFIGLQRHAPGQVRNGTWAAFRNVYVKRLRG